MPAHTFQLLPDLSPSSPHYFSILLYSCNPSAHSASCTLSLEIPTQRLFLYGTPLSMYVWSTSSVVRFAPILQFFTWNNVMPQDLKNFPKVPVHKCSLVPCDALSHLSCWHPYRRTDFSLLLKILKFVAIDTTFAFHIWQRWIKAKFAFWIYIFIYCYAPPMLVTSLPKYYNLFTSGYHSHFILHEYTLISSNICKECHKQNCLLVKLNSQLLFMLCPCTCVHWQ